MKKLCFVLMMTLCMSQVAALGLTKDLNHEVDGIRDQLGTAREFLVQQADELDRTLTTNNDYNNLVCLGLGTVQVTSTTIQEMVELIDARLTSRHDELAETIDRAADDVSGDEYVIQQYHGLLDHEIDQLAVLYQQYINDMIITIQQQITTDEQGFSQLAASNHDMLVDLTTKRATLARLAQQTDEFRVLATQWSDFREQHVERVGLLSLVTDESVKLMREYFEQQHSIIQRVSPEVAAQAIRELQEVEDRHIAQWTGQLADFFGEYLGYFDPAVAEETLADWERIHAAYYLTQTDEMNCPVIAAGRKDLVIQLYTDRLDDADSAVRETLTTLGGLAPVEDVLRTINSQLDVLYSNFVSKQLTSGYIAYKNELLLELQEEYKQKQELIDSVTLPYTQSQLVELLSAAAAKQDDRAAFDARLETALVGLRAKLEGTLSRYQRALTTLLIDAIEEYLAQ